MSLVNYLSKDRLLEILDRCTDLRIGIVGDLGLDAYWHADMTISELSRETPLYPRPVLRETYSPGAGANVANNVQALGAARVVVLSVLGKDWRGNILSDVMAGCGMDTGSLLTSSRRNTTTFIKPILKGYNSEQEDARIDFENAEPLAADLEGQLIARVTGQLAELDALLVADQLDVNGIITPDVREALNDLAASNPDKVFVVDSRQHIGLFHNMVLKPNWTEAIRAVAPKRDLRAVERDEIPQLGITLSERSQRPAFVTLSEDGVLVCHDGASHHIPTAVVRPPLDPVGAGDTFISALAVSLAAGATPCEAGAMANLAASVTVEKLKITGTASPQEIIDRYTLTEKEQQTHE
jgi:rfaE bifunctional protein kinase chain/domain